MICVWSDYRFRRLLLSTAYGSCTRNLKLTLAERERNGDAGVAAERCEPDRVRARFRVAVVNKMLRQVEQITRNVTRSMNDATITHKMQGNSARTWYMRNPVQCNPCVQRRIYARCLRARLGWEGAGRRNRVRRARSGRLESHNCPDRVKISRLMRKIRHARGIERCDSLINLRAGTPNARAGRRDWMAQEHFIMFYGKNDGDLQKT